MAGKTTKSENSVVKVTDADGRVHFTGRHSALATAPGANVTEVDDDDAALSTPGDADNTRAAGN